MLRKCKGSQASDIFIQVTNSINSNAVLCYHCCPQNNSSTSISSCWARLGKQLCQHCGLKRRCPTGCPGPVRTHLLCGPLIPRLRACQRTRCVPQSADLPVLVLLLQTKPTQRRLWGSLWGVTWEQGLQPELSSVWANPRTGPSDQLDVRALAKHHGCLGNCYQISVYKYKILNLAWVLKLTSRQASPPTKAQ